MVDRKGIKKFIALIIVASMTLFLITGCSGNKKSGDASGEGKTQVLEIAHLAPLTGSAASYGVQIVEAAKMAVYVVARSTEFV